MNLFGIFDVGVNRLTYNRQYGVTNTGIAAQGGALQPVAEVVSGRRQDADPVQPAPAARPSRTTRCRRSSRSRRSCSTRASRSSRRGTTRSSARPPTRMGFQTSDGQCDPTQVKQDIFVWCHNPVQIGVDPDACKADLKPQLDAQGQRRARRRRQSDLAHAARRSAALVDRLGQRAAERGSARLRAAGCSTWRPARPSRRQAYIYGGALDTYAARSRDLVELHPRQPVARGLRRRHQHQGLGRVEPGGRVDQADDADAATRCATCTSRWTSRGRAARRPRRRSTRRRRRRSSTAGRTAKTPCTRRTRGGSRRPTCRRCAATACAAGSSKR